MLIRFRVRNFLSFREEIEFSMIPGRARLHPDHIISKGSGRNDVNLLRAGVVYGANASGKSNLVHVLGFAKKFITEGVGVRKLIPRSSFKLDKENLKQPSKFEFEIRSGGKDYLYGFEVDNEKIYSEWLHEIKKTTTALIFEREFKSQETQFEFGNLGLKTKKDAEFLEFIARGTRSNQLFLKETIDREINYFDEIFNWFDNLNIIYPGTRYDLDLDVSNEKTISLVKYLERLGTGVSGFSLEQVSMEAELPKGLIDNILENFKSDSKASLATINSSDGQRYSISKNEQGEIVMSKFMLKHKMADSDEETPFDTHEESDGTIRLMDVLPVVANTKNTPKVYVIDELDRSLHPNLSYELIEDFLRQSRQSQLIVTTHDANLLSFDLLRRDEIWFVEKDQEGASSVYSLEEFTPRYDKNIRKGYLKGRFGAIPMIGKKSF